MRTYVQQLKIQYLNLNVYKSLAISISQQIYYVYIMHIHINTPEATNIVLFNYKGILLFIIMNSLKCLP